MVLISIATSREYHARSTNKTETATDLDGTGKREVHENRNSNKTSKASIEQGIDPENKHQESEYMAASPLLLVLTRAFCLAIRARRFW